MAWTTPRTWVAGEQPTASLFNAHIRDNLNIIAAVGITGWTDYSASATWTGSTNPTYSVYRARYCQVGKLVVYQARYTYTSGGTGTWLWSLPVTAAIGGNHVAGSGNAYDTSAGGTFLISMDLNSTTALRALYDQQTSLGVVTQTVPFTFAAGDVVAFVVKYEAA